MSGRRDTSLRDTWHYKKDWEVGKELHGHRSGGAVVDDQWHPAMQTPQQTRIRCFQCGFPGIVVDRDLTMTENRGMRFDVTDVGVNIIGGNDLNTQLLLDMNGTDGSTSFTDLSDSAHVVTAVGDAQVDTSQKKFGTGALLLDRVGDYLSIPNSPDFRLGAGSGRFTLETQIRFNTLTGSDQQTIEFSTDSDNRWYFRFSNTLEQLGFNVFNGSIKEVALDRTWVPELNTWYHIAVIRGWNNQVNEWALTVDGTILGSSLVNSTIIGNYSNELFIGANLVPGNFVDGWMDEVRISNIARWTSNFTAPTVAYDDSVATLFEPVPTHGCPQCSSDLGAFGSDVR